MWCFAWCGLDYNTRQPTAKPFGGPYGFWVKGSRVALHPAPWRQTGTCAEPHLHTHLHTCVRHSHACAHSQAVRRISRSCRGPLSVFCQRQRRRVCFIDSHVRFHHRAPRRGFLYELPRRNPGSALCFRTISAGWSEIQMSVAQETCLFHGPVTCLERITNTANRGSWNVLLGPLLVFVGEPRAGGNCCGKWSNSLVAVKIFSLSTLLTCLQDWSAVGAARRGVSCSLTSSHTFLRHVRWVYNLSNH